MFNDLWNTDFVLAATCVGCRQLSRLEVSPYQEALLARGVRHRHQGQAPDGRMEQAMGYTGAVGTMLMDEIVRIAIDHVTWDAYTRHFKVIAYMGVGRR